MHTPVYLDCNATTPVDPRVVEAMLPCFQQVFGNSSSKTNRHGQAALELLEQARAQVALAAGAEPAEVYFTSGATESINTVLQGIVRGKTWADVRIVTCVTEHSAVLDTCSVVEKLGARVTRLSVDSAGHLDLGHLDNVLASSGAGTLVSLMHANNEIGVVHPVAEIAQLCKRHGCLLHIDAAQTFGKLPIKLRDWQTDFLSISGHKIYAPKGVGALVIRRQTPPLRLTPLLHGGGQERGIRSGTVNVAGAVALGKAAEIAHSEMQNDARRIMHLRDTLLQRLRAGIPDITINGCLKHRLDNNLNVSFSRIAEPQFLLPRLQDSVSLSSASACKSGSTSPSHVLTALGLPAELAQTSLRFGIGRFTTAEEVEFAAQAVARVVGELRQ